MNSWSIGDFVTRTVRLPTQSACCLLPVSVCVLPFVRANFTASTCPRHGRKCSEVANALCLCVQPFKTPTHLEVPVPTDPPLYVSTGCLHRAWRRPTGATTRARRRPSRTSAGTRRPLRSGRRGSTCETAPRRARPLTSYGNVFTHLFYYRCTAGARRGSSRRLGLARPGDGRRRGTRPEATQRCDRRRDARRRRRSAACDAELRA